MSISISNRFTPYPSIQRNGGYFLPGKAKQLEQLAEEQEKILYNKWGLGMEEHFNTETLTMLLKMAITGVETGSEEAIQNYIAKLKTDLAKTQENIDLVKLEKFKIKRTREELKEFTEGNAFQKAIEHFAGVTTPTGWMKKLISYLEQNTPDAPIYVNTESKNKVSIHQNGENILGLPKPEKLEEEIKHKDKSDTSDQWKLYQTVEDLFVNPTARVIEMLNPREARN
jgi:hypothetical protein